MLGKVADHHVSFRIIKKIQVLIIMINFCLSMPFISGFHPGAVLSYISYTSAKYVQLRKVPLSSSLVWDRV